ncbi:tRNA glutamyl-Q synthetase [Halioglobus sp. HI00S01]|uniref:tRNA glutamyl-Q(34) synthetase GluQRS n=1 Tax=Halioglobus sp. HI00S01 TaxID=1822214 RepID=UPI0007C2D2E0|nr:tRNA glutamyl-Q(34) synthetase GluQRS [Halioglobus sp. HI00S01]KZX56969.1 tRNA glutamyl-Q synthetase [Halioglobus sp. HI00S01]
MPHSPTAYRGRFAPSPTGPLHLGSLIAALASYLDARASDGTWLVRMEDLDPPREQPGAADSILRSLEAHGLTWDESVLWQSQRHEAYTAALAELERKQLLFSCDCTRATLGPGGACRGRCLPRQEQLKPPCARRVRVPESTVIQFQDAYQGPQQDALGSALPDFTLQRKDTLYAYQLAVVVDDGFQAISHIVRGSDLLDSTPRQYYLQRCLDLPHPAYGHLPVITNELGQKYSKQNHAPALDGDRAAHNLRQALAFLHQSVPPADAGSPQEILDYACQHWQPGAIPGVMGLPAAQLPTA